ncbi:hypothetical protein GCM10023085_10870 [Actinomadura viridis]|uniref:Uncharacterized protein n=1 Tax=Actinomadura viridis TaxID=58110 RepID=A0A931DSX1_9ACTN|nr:hypothetical protein [Actinomadura viridis]MBG6092093.1 hypothetical protein [Actinomadura viridis]
MGERRYGYVEPDRRDAQQIGYSVDRIDVLCHLPSIPTAGRGGATEAVDVATKALAASPAVLIAPQNRIGEIAWPLTPRS